MIDQKKLESLVRLMVENDLSELDLRDGEESIRLKRGGPPPPASAPPPMTASASSAPAAAEGGAIEDAGLIAIESPMVGTFYAAADPDSPPFAQVGSRVGPDTVVCLVEAMKVFNEVKAETSGVVERVLVSNGEAVEFGQKLFLVRPS